MEIKLSLYIFHHNIIDFVIIHHSTTLRFCLRFYGFPYRQHPSESNLGEDE